MGQLSTPIDRLALPAGAKDTLESLLDELEYLVSAQKKVDQRLRVISQEQDEARRIAAMRSVPGVGEVVATTFAAEIFRPGRFNRSEEGNGLSWACADSAAKWFRQGDSALTSGWSTSITKFAHRGSMDVEATG